LELGKEIKDGALAASLGHSALNAAFRFVATASKACPVACNGQQHRRAEAAMMMMNDEVEFCELSTAFPQRFETS
jgi:hypothetical protein